MTKTQKIIANNDNLSGLRVTVMGLGVHGGGLTVAQYLSRHNAQVTVTDLKSEAHLRPSLEHLDSSIRLVLGRHEYADFETTDMIVKNPGVPSTSTFLKAARDSDTPIETDISLFRKLYPATPLITITGSKGKSTTASALHYTLKHWHPDARLGGNITRSPLAFAEELSQSTPVILELSSWQLGDLPSPAILRPKVAILTNLLPDHQDEYDTFRHYVHDKMRMFSGQKNTDQAIVGIDTLRWFEKPLKAREWCVGITDFQSNQAGVCIDGNRLWFQGIRESQQHFITSSFLKGVHNLLNLAMAGLGVAAFVGTDKLAEINHIIRDFPGLEHRMEEIGEWQGVRFINDSAATMPHATAAALSAIQGPVTLLVGGGDKKLNFKIMQSELQKVVAAVLIDGSATNKISTMLKNANIKTYGPFFDLDTAVQMALQATRSGGTILFSPAATSFGMFDHEFMRGQTFKRIVSKIIYNR